MRLTKPSPRRFSTSATRAESTHRLFQFDIVLDQFARRHTIEHNASLAAQPMAGTRTNRAHVTFQMNSYSGADEAD
jgi:hypothetical protein